MDTEGLQGIFAQGDGEATSTDLQRLVYQTFGIATPELVRRHIRCTVGQDCGTATMKELETLMTREIEQMEENGEIED